MMEQYQKIKAQHPDKLLLFQVGDFYELFFDDAELAARELEIALTSRDAGSENPIPLAGVPIHAAETYLNRLLARGHKVVICDQVESAQQAKGLVRREITRILTPGTVTDPEMLDEGNNNYLVALVNRPSIGFGLAVVDISTGDFRITEETGPGAEDNLLDEIKRLKPAEIICHPEILKQKILQVLNSHDNILTETIPNLPDRQEAENLILNYWSRNTYDTLNLQRFHLAATAAALALTYLTLLQQLSADHSPFRNLELYFIDKSMVIDNITSRNLELCQSLRDGGKKGSLLALIDYCLTGMGKRLLKRRLEQPLLERKAIETRLDAVEELVGKPLLRDSLRKKLDRVFDLERFCSRLAYQRVNARDLVYLKNSLVQITPLKTLLDDFDAALWHELNDHLTSFDKLIDKLGSALVDDPPLTLKEGGVIRKGYHAEADRLRQLANDSSNLLLEYEQEERRKSGIKTLKVGYNRNFGYYIEITKSNLNAVPDYYLRRQTLVNAERFTTGELQQLEEQITGAREKLNQLEYSLFEELRNYVNSFSGDLQAASLKLAAIDCLQSLAEAADRNNYTRPSFHDRKLLKLKGARHPVVEQLASDSFVPNDLVMDQNHYLLLITGPNMAGKSTYIRSAALITIMAQAGSFVPAESADLPLLDRVFARVGASDDLSRGHSTFMVEMQETALILKEATADSLIILDEIGRGTSTYDGMSIARGVIEYLSEKIRALTLFSTHYHELTRLEGELAGVKNYTMAVREKGKEVIFLRQVVPGRADKSYGINVARLAGVPREVLYRAEAILAELELASSAAAEQQLSLLPLVSEPRCDHERELEIAEQIKNLDLNRMTPLESMQSLYELQKELLKIDHVQPPDYNHEGD